MSGIEVVGLVLGAFPILLNCLEYYREGFEPLEEWWCFRTSFVAFIDGIRHQQMKYHGTLMRLLDPIVTENSALKDLIDNPSDPRWKDGSLTDQLNHRLSSEKDRFFRIIDRMSEIMKSLEKLLQIENRETSWLFNSKEKPIQWHFKRLQISFSKGKDKKVKKLEVHNKELEEIICFSERNVPIADRRKSSQPVALLENIRKHASNVHDTLRKRWQCEGGGHIHEAYLNLRAEVTSVKLSVMFIFSSEGDETANKRSEEIIIQPNKKHISTQPMNFSHVQQSATLGATQAVFESQYELSNTKSNLIPRRSLFHGISSSLGFSRKNVKFMTDQTEPLVCSSRPSTPAIIADDMISVGLAGSGPISDICIFLQDKESGTGIVEDEYDNHLEFSKPRKGKKMVVSGNMKLHQLRRVLSDNRQDKMELSRKDRFEIATHIVSALLQTYPSPWLPRKWSKDEFYLLVNTDKHSLYSTRPFISKRFVQTKEANAARENDEDEGLVPRRPSEQDIRDCFLSIGIIVLELIFGKNIEDCAFYKDYYGKDGKPNDQTDMSAARRWSRTVAGDSGPDVDDVVRRCLDCSFGPKPDLSDARFKESVYEHVIKPLRDYKKEWQEDRCTEVY